MDFLDVNNIHNNCAAEVNIGLKKDTVFKLKNSGSEISMEDSANTVNKFKIGGPKGFSVSVDGDELTIEDNQKKISKVKFGGPDGFTISVSGNQLAIEDTAKSVNKLKIGGPSGFSISLVGNHIVFSSNSGESPLCVSEPGKGGIPGCAYYYCHQDKYSGVSANSLNASAAPVACALAMPVEENNQSNDIPDPKSLSDGSLMMVSNGKWVTITMEDLINQIKSNLI